ncbi:Uncharacterized protein GBIM_14014 [Gryllus bimaculatus]|nr:Uncharacterized protein GBIM_14014 [Gryllus bimaculatus]
MDSSEDVQRSWRHIGALAVFTILLLAPAAYGKSKKGIPELRLPPFDPLSLQQLELQEGHGSLRFVMRFKNASITGFRDVQLHSVQGRYTTTWTPRRDATNNFLNENWREAFQTYKHLPEEAFGQIFLEIENGFFDQFPLEELFPE